MGFSFNPSLLFECRSCKHLFRTTDKLKEHKLANHLGDCLRIKCIIFKETFLDVSFSTDKSKTDPLPKQSGQCNPHQLSRPMYELRNPYVLLERVNLLEVNGKSRKRHAAQSNHLLDYPVSKRSKQQNYFVSENTNDKTEEAIIASPKPHDKVVEDQTEVPFPTPTKISTPAEPTFLSILSSNENQSQDHPKTDMSPSNKNQSESIIELGNVGFIVASVETSADGTEMVQFECFNREFENLDQQKDLDNFSDIKGDLEDNGADLELELHSPKNTNEAEQVFTTAPNSPDYEPESSSDESVKMSSSSNVKDKKALKKHTQSHSNSVWKCTLDQCQASFKYKRGLNLHLDAHKRNTCSVPNCNATFSSQQLLIRHMRTHEGEQATFDTSLQSDKQALSENKLIKCSECPSTFKHYNTRISHMITVHGKETQFKCSICDKFFAKRRDVGDHERRIHTKDCPFKCDVTGCSKSFPSKANLFSHRKRAHNPSVAEVKMLKCSQCPSTFKHKYTRTSHMILMHGKETKFKCKICGKCFTQRRQVEDHERRHTKEFPFKCNAPDCSRSFPSKTDLCRHRKTVHNPGGAQKMLKCSQCPSTFKHRHTRANHMVLVHGKETNFKCRMCGKCFIQTRKWKEHERRHLKDCPFKCDVPDCSKSFPSKSDLWTHQRKIHSVELGLATFLCAACGQTFGLQSLLNMHVRIHHENSRPFKCTFDDSCSRAFSCKRALTEHERLSHTFEKPYQCDKCGKSYAAKDTFSRHVQRHEGPVRRKGFSCTFCPRKFQFKGSFVAHVKSHESGTMFNCSYCEFQFGSMRMLTTHEKSHQEKDAVNENELVSGD